MKDSNLKIITKSISLGLASFVIFLLFLAGGFLLSEGYNLLNPYADTEFAQNYSPEKFRQVKEGMKMPEILKLTGEPLNSSYDTARGMIYHSYTRDGWLRRQPGFSLSLCGDLAWYGSSVEYGPDSTAVKVYSGWYYD